ncbi:ferredoxin-type protein NapF [Halovulum sp. GXIMD14794]
MRPPGSVQDFHDLCTGCGDCIVSCPEGIIVRDEDRLPVVDFVHGACTFCGACAEVCPAGALAAGHVADWPWRARITDSCFSLRGITCRACEDVCEPRAIRFRLATGGRSRPVLDLDQCTGCGDCAHACPADAVSFDRRDTADPEVSR